MRCRRTVAGAPDGVVRQHRAGRRVLDPPQGEHITGRDLPVREAEPPGEQDFRIGHPRCPRVSAPPSTPAVIGHATDGRGEPGVRLGEAGLRVGRVERMVVA